MDILKDSWWQTGSLLPEKHRAALSQNENQFFEGYDKLMAEYGTIVFAPLCSGSRISLLTRYMDAEYDLSSSSTPPTDLMIEVRVLQDHGDFMTDTGVVNLKKNTTHYLKRADCELLIRQNVLQVTGK